jgi:hypothetical protein
MKKANPIAKSLRNPINRPRTIPDKRRTSHDYERKNWSIAPDDWDYARSVGRNELAELIRQEVNAR